MKAQMYMHAGFFNQFNPSPPIENRIITLSQAIKLDSEVLPVLPILAKLSHPPIFISASLPQIKKFAPRTNTKII